MLIHYKLFLLCLVCATPRCAKKSAEIFTYQLGSTNVQVERIAFAGAANLAVVHVHDNEITAQKAAATVLAKAGGSLVTLKNKQERLLKFRHEGAAFFADPNRIFTTTGRGHTLAKYSRFTEGAAQQLKAFADSFIQLLPQNQTIVAIHNNTNKAYSIGSYKKEGQFYNEAAALYINDALDSDDFFLTTNLDLYNSLKAKNYNVVLQHNTKAADDGSLSIYYGRKNSSYVNVEAEHGHLTQQTQMLMDLQELLEQLKLNEINSK